MTTEDKYDIVAPTDLLPHDVVLGKMASGNFSSPGNRLFKQFLMKKKRDYSQVSSHSGKKRFLAQCVDEWCNRMDGRFLFRETTILCTVVKSDEDRAKLLTKVNALMRNLPSPSSSQAAESEIGSATVPLHEESHTTPKKQRKPIASVATSVTVSSTSSDASESEGNESQDPASIASPVETTPDTRKKPSLSVVTEEKLLEDSPVKAKSEDTHTSDALISSDSSTDEVQNSDNKTKETPAAISKKNQLRPSPTSITGFHQVQEDETVREESSPLLQM
jgi:hypothetical protein